MKQRTVDRIEGVSYKGSPFRVNQGLSDLGNFSEKTESIGVSASLWLIFGGLPRCDSVVKIWFGLAKMRRNRHDSADDKDVSLREVTSCARPI